MSGFFGNLNVENWKNWRSTVKMSRTQRRFPAIVALFGLLVLGGAPPVAAAKTTHHDARQLLAANLKTDGCHDIDHRGEFTTSVDVKNGKVAGVHVRHSERGEIPVKKYKTHRKMAQAVHTRIVYASFPSAQDQDLGTVYIGYAYVDDDGNEEIYWFPAEMILDGETGAIEYVATS
jgi:hypothetical protein